MIPDRFTAEEIAEALANVATGIQVQGMSGPRSYINQSLEPETTDVFMACVGDALKRLGLHHRCSEVTQALMNCIIVGAMIGIHAQRAREAAGGA